MAYVKNTWVDREGQIRYQETIDNDGTLILTPNYEQITEMGTPVNADNMNHIEEGIGEHENRITVLENLPNKYLNKSQITNCILEIPQRIKLELADGVLTLKAGSEVIVPNGFEEDGVTPKFDYITVESNKQYVTFGNNAQTMVYITDVLDMASLWVSNAYSGSSAPSGQQYMLWYDTVNNLVKFTQNSGSTWLSGFALPIGIATSTTTNFSSIDQVFNGMGYIGSTIWVDKGVKGLIPDGRNGDGTLKNVEYTQSTIKTFSYNLTGEHYISLSNSAINPLAFIGNGAYYDKIDNLINDYGIKRSLAIIGQCTLTSGVVSNFSSKQPFRAIDYSDKAEVSGWGMPSNKTLQLTPGASGTIYTAPANGYIQGGIKKANNSDVAYINISTREPNTSETLLQQQGWIAYNASAGYTARVFVPCQKGQIIYVGYYNATIDFLQFIYAEGDQ